HGRRLPTVDLSWVRFCPNPFAFWTPKMSFGAVLCAEVRISLAAETNRRESQVAEGSVVLGETRSKASSARVPQSVDDRPMRIRMDSPTSRSDLFEQILQRVTARSSRHAE